MVFLKERIGKLTEWIEELRYGEKYALESYRMKHSDGRYPDVESLDSAGWDELNNKEIWGGHREYFYFDTTFTVPKEAEGKALCYELRTGHEGEWDAINPQFLVYVNGKKRMGMDVNHRELLLTENAKAGESYRIVLAAYTGDNNFSILLDSCVKVFYKDVDKYYYDIKVPYDVARLLNAEDDAHIKIILALNESLNLVDMRVPHSKEFFESIAKADEYLNKNFYEKYCGDSKHTVYCTGHTHIDLAWLWTLDTTKDKTVRSFSTVLELMKRYPEYKFMHSQPQEYLYVKENAPELYEEIKERVKEGRWQPEGAMWVEADCNIPSGESLVRQFLYGIRFFKEEFDKPSKMLWLPDVFGYSAALPQIMKLANVDYFMTTKISWSEFNKMPCDTFYWEGIDGSRILTHFIPARDYNAKAKEGSAENEHFTTYNGMLNPSQVMGGWQRYSQKHLNDEVLMSYGWGDGGGGPTIEMLENEKRLSKGIPGSPATKQCLPTEFFEVLEKNVKDNKYTPLWSGELYLEYHRGTYTSMARNKKFNRMSEFAYQNMEFFAKMAELYLGEKYPKEELAEGWRTILKNQFHDILPGSAIKEVYEESKREYENILDIADRYVREYTKKLADAIDAKANDIVIFNPNGQSAKAPVCIALEDAKGKKTISDGEKTYDLQETEDGMLAVIPAVAEHGTAIYSLCDNTKGDIKNDSKDGCEENVFEISKSKVETKYFSIEIDENGKFTRIYDKAAKREMLKEGERGNVLMTYEDHPHNFDAWDINNYYTEKSWEIEKADSVEVLENGPVRACIKVTYSYLSSKLVQYIYFYRDLYRFDIRNEIDWKEKNILLRSYFPMDIHATEATYEIQYGNVKRPTHYNTSWDFAKFEVCAHKWIDLSETDYGLSVINNCKFGYSIHDGVIGLTMLKSAVYPNPDADKEHHSFTYSFCPHNTSLAEADTVAKAYVFNNPYIAVRKEKDGSDKSLTGSFVKTDSKDVVVEAVKKAEDGDEIIVRLYEAQDRRKNVKVTFASDIASAEICNILEEKIADLIFNKNEAELSFKPFEIKTIKVTLK
ncbi:MAG: alpha-mannosidase [Lachnospiraceae bacterium]|nr:alpha-mannosidase [Lachnospiraceae bacterium]